MVRYVDSGSRQSQDALGTWLDQELMGPVPPTALRLQSGFYGAASLGYLEGALSSLEQADGHTRILVGSNDGQTPRSDIADLLAIAGQPRTNLRLGVVSFQTGFFHPKVYHFVRADGSMTAYVGSANLTGPGVRSLHVEAGLILDSKSGDAATLVDIANAIDEWFIATRPGLYEVAVDSDLDPLVQANVLGVTRPPRVKRTVTPAPSSGSSSTKKKGHSLHPLVAVPLVQQALPSANTSTGTRSGTGTAGQPGATSSTPLPPATPAVTPPPVGASVKHWGKKLSDSDAQRKKTGNQRGAITLVQGDYRGKIDQTTYFRNDLFVNQAWQTGTANTGQPIERTTVPMNVTIDGTYHGTMDFLVTNGTSRESSQNNYTSELHIEPIGALIRQNNISGKHLDIALDANGDYWLTIA